MYPTVLKNSVSILERSVAVQSATSISGLFQPTTLNMISLHNYKLPMSTSIADTCSDCTALLKWVFSVEHGVRRPVHDYPKDGSMLLESHNCKLCDLIKPCWPFDAEIDMIIDIEIRAERDQNRNIAALHVELAYDTSPYRYSVHRIHLWAEKGHCQDVDDEN